MSQQKEDLNQYKAGYTDFNARLIRWRYSRLAQYFTGDTCLELGPSEGDGTTHLLDHFRRVVAVDGSDEATAALKQKFQGKPLEVITSYFEDLKLAEKFDTVVLAHILEHVDNPHEVLLVAKKYVKSDGVIVVDVPNAMSLHRQLGVRMGMLDKVTDLNEADHSIGHKRVYTPEAFRAEIAAAGLDIQRFGGMFLKVLSNTHTEKLFDDKQIAAFLRMGEDYPDIAAEIFVIAALND